MKQKNIYLIIFFASATLAYKIGETRMQNNIYLENIFGIWKSEPRNTEWGEALFKFYITEKKRKFSMFNLEDITDINSLIAKLRSGNEEKYDYVRSKLLQNGIKSVENFDSNELKAKKIIVKNLNQLLLDTSFYSENKFNSFYLNNYMKKFILDKNNKDSLINVNRFLLERIFPEEIKNNQNKIKIEVYFKINPGDDIAATENEIVIVDDLYVLTPSLTVESEIVSVGLYSISPFYNKGEPYIITIKNDSMKIDFENIKDEKPIILHRIKK